MEAFVWKSKQPQRRKQEITFARLAMLLAAPSASPESQSKVPQLVSLLLTAAVFNPTWLTTRTRRCPVVLPPCLLLTFLPLEKEFKVAPAEAMVPVIFTPVRSLDNLFFIEEPKNISVTESKWSQRRPSSCSSTTRKAASLCRQTFPPVSTNVSYRICTNSREMAQ